MSDEAGVLEEADRNMVEVWRHVAGGGPAPEQATTDGVLLLSSGIPVALFNPAFVVGPVADAARAVERVAEHYGSRGLPFALVFRDAVAPGLADACAAAGMIEHWQMPLMVLEPIPADGGAGAHPDGVEVVAVDASTVEAYGDVLAAGFGMPREVVAQLLGADILKIDGFVAFLALLDGQPVASSALYLSDRTAGVYNVATVESARRRGAGAAVTWAAARAGRERGAVRSVLQASEMGEPVYARMGYATPDRYRQFEPSG